jgi:hypothetical protein
MGFIVYYIVQYASALAGLVMSYIRKKDSAEQPKS